MRSDPFVALSLFKFSFICSDRIETTKKAVTTGTGDEIIDPVFAKTSQNACFLLSENERFGLVFVKTGSINSGTEV
jgi:hypothetical protein